MNIFHSYNFVTQSSLNFYVIFTSSNRPRPIELCDFSSFPPQLAGILSLCGLPKTEWNNDFVEFHVQFYG